jgi:hypothetical protein
MQTDSVENLAHNSSAGSTLFVDPGRFTLIVTSHYPIEQCSSAEAEREAIKGRFQEAEMTVDNSDMLMRCRLNRE